MTIEIKVPVLPESVADASIATWHVKVGDKVSRDQSLVDIETDKVVLEVVAPADGVISEIFQGAGHTPTAFNGEKLGNHPYLINATANCNFSDTGTSDYIFFLPPININTDGHTREYIMDQNPWTYKIMGQELINENKYEVNQDPTHWELSDVRNYIYLEYNSSQSGTINSSKIYALFYNDCYNYSNTHNDPDIEFSIGNGVHRTAIELPKDVEMVMPGDNVVTDVEMITSIAMDKELRFAIREGGRTVGAGVVTEIVE